MGPEVPTFRVSLLSRRFQSRNLGPCPDNLKSEGELKLDLRILSSVYTYAHLSDSVNTWSVLFSARLPRTRTGERHRSIDQIASLSTLPWLKGVRNVLATAHRIIAMCLWTDSPAACPLECQTLRHFIIHYFGFLFTLWCSTVAPQIRSRTLGVKPILVERCYQSTIFRLMYSRIYRIEAHR